MPYEEGMQIPFDVPPQSEVEEYLKELQRAEEQDAEASPPDICNVDDFELFGEDHYDDAEPKVTSANDFWSFNGTLLVRHHVVPRLHLYHPDDSCPIPFKVDRRPSLYPASQRSH